jgi:hypothetical protein
MSWLLIADSNEQAHSAAEGVDRRAYLAANTGLECETRPLTVGDYALLWVDGGEEKAVALIERKAMADMVASIKDTRYVSQSQRMEASGVPFLYWAIVNGPASHEDEDRIASALVHLSTPAYPRTRVLRVADSDLSFARAIRSLARYLHDALHKGNALAEAPLHTVAQEAGARPRLDTQPLVWRNAHDSAWNVATKRQGCRRRPPERHFSLARPPAQPRRPPGSAAASRRSQTQGGDARRRPG